MHASTHRNQRFVFHVRIEGALAARHKMVERAEHRLALRRRRARNHRLRVRNLVEPRQEAAAAPSQETSDRHPVAEVTSRDVQAARRFDSFPQAYTEARRAVSLDVSEDLACQTVVVCRGLWCRPTVYGDDVASHALKTVKSLARPQRVRVSQHLQQLLADADDRQRLGVGVNPLTCA